MAETVLEDAALLLARALANHFKKTGDLDRHCKVDMTKSESMKLRTRDLVNKTTAIRDLGTAAVSEPGADGRGVTAARVAALTAAITAFSKVRGNWKPTPGEDRGGRKQTILPGCVAMNSPAPMN